jgi:quinol monooxygenase YgiN
MFVVIVKITAKPDAADRLAETFRAMVEWVDENEPDTTSYTCSRSTDDPRRFAFFERYESRRAFESHTTSKKFLELAVEMQGLVDGPIEIDTYDELAAKI